MECKDYITEASTEKKYAPMIQHLIDLYNSDVFKVNF